MSENCIVDFASPTLAGIKTGSLFFASYNDMEECTSFLRNLNSSLVCKGIKILPLKIANGRVMLYCYRPDALKRDLERPEAKAILKGAGYKSTNIPDCIFELRKRIQEGSEFPHEIGLFLGYPPYDVKCFIENRNDEVKCIGCWKVYGNRKKAEETFEKYRRCTACYKERLKNGATVEELAVAL